MAKPIKFSALQETVIKTARDMDLDRNQGRNDRADEVIDVYQQQHRSGSCSGDCCR